jgi:hypothetical protein
VGPRSIDHAFPSPSFLQHKDGGGHGRGPKQSPKPSEANRRAHGGHGRGRSILAGAPVPPPRLTGGSRDAAAQDAVQVASAVPAPGARGLLAPRTAPAVPAPPKLAPPPVQDAGRGAGRQPGDGGRHAEAEAARGRGAARRARAAVSTERAPGEAEAGEGRRG